MSGVAVELRSVVKRFGSTPVLTDVDLTAPAGRLTAVLGESGSGKTTLLRLIAGFERLDAGRIAIGGQVLDDGSHSVRPQHRGVGYVPQEGALFPHLTALGNVGFGLPRRARAQARELLGLVGLAGLERRYAHELSGGQQQRVALARALAVRPSVVLLDEPFGSLDASLRGEIGRDVARILADAGTTAVLVTHDQGEALALADRIAVLAHGRVMASEAPRELYGNPGDPTAARSIGESNLLSATAGDDGAICALGTVAVLDSGGGSGRLRGAVQLLLRPEQLRLHLHPTDAARAGAVLELRYHGHDAVACVELEGGGCDPLLVRVPGESVLTRGQRVWIEALGPARAWASGAAPTTGTAGEGDSDAAFSKVTA